MRSFHDLRGCVTSKLPGNKFVVAFSAWGRSHFGILPGNNLKIDNITELPVASSGALVTIGTKVRFSCHEFGSKEQHEYDWYITNAWLMNDTSLVGRTPGVFLGLYNCSGQVRKLQNRSGVLSFKDHQGLVHSVLFLASKCFIRGKRMNTKQSLSSVFNEENILLFDAIPCIPEENDFKCDWFALYVWSQGPRPHEYISTASEQALSSTLSQYKMIAASPKSLFVRGVGQVLKILNSEYGTALMAVQKNRWDSVLFHRSCSYLFKGCLATRSLEEVFQEGDKLNIIAVPAPKSMIAQWVAVQVGIVEGNELQLASDLQY